MRPTENIKRLIENAKIKTNPQVNEAVLKDLLTEMDKSERMRSTAPQPNVWRTIMKSKLTKFAAAEIISVESLAVQMSRGVMLSSLYLTPALPCLI
jgi:hypothetical protein